jgi:hypothetical protein
MIIFNMFCIHWKHNTDYWHLADVGLWSNAFFTKCSQTINIEKQHHHRYMNLCVCERERFNVVKRKFKFCVLCNYAIHNLGAKFLLIQIYATLQIADKSAFEFTALPPPCDYLEVHNIRLCIDFSIFVKWSKSSHLNFHRKNTSQSYYDNHLREQNLAFKVTKLLHSPSKLFRLWGKEVMEFNTFGWYISGTDCLVFSPQLWIN